MDVRIWQHSKQIKVSALDLTKIVMIESNKENKNSSVLTNEDIAWQEARRNRKVRRLDFEIR